MVHQEKNGNVMRISEFNIDRGNNELYHLVGGYQGKCSRD